jgi:hypothetical protein
MLRPQKIFKAAGRYLRRHPEEVGRAVRNAIGMRFGIPIEAFRWLAGEMLDGDKVEDLVIEADEPGLAVAATFDLMKSRVRAGATIFIDRVEIDGDKMKVEVRLEEVSMTPIGEKKTQISALLRAEALDLSRPGDLVAYLPDMPAVIVSAHGNRIILDLMKIPKLGRDPKVRHAVGLLSSLVTLHRIETNDRHLDLNFRPLPSGLTAAADAVNRHIVRPGWRRARRVLPEPVRGELEARMKYVVEKAAAL